LTYLRNMSAGNKELMLEMISIFKKQVSEFVKEMDLLYTNNEFENLGKLAHKAKSSISIMGMADLAKDLKTFENMAKAGIEPHTYPAFIQKFKDETSEAISELDMVSGNIDIYI
jgi:HPt (histidine-containing phosphotransfer) domain-containing protein